MKKHAYLIMSHNNFDILKKLIHSLDYEDNEIFVHVDTKATFTDCTLLYSLTSKAKIRVYSALNTNWAAYSLVECELFLMEQARQTGNFVYYHLLSGSDFPIKSHKYIVQFFEKNNGYEFIEYRDETFKNNQEYYERWVKFYYPIQEYRKISSNKFISNSLRYIAKIGSGIQFIFHVDRWRNNKMILKYGSQWFSITEDLVEYLLSQKNKIYHSFHMTLCPDELFIQTIAYNSKFRNKIYQYSMKSKTSGNLREINWEKSESKSHPYIWKEQDFETLLTSPNLFARKFDENIDIKIVERLSSQLEEKTNGEKGSCPDCNL